MATVLSAHGQDASAKISCHNCFQLKHGAQQGSSLTRAMSVIAGVAVEAIDEDWQLRPHDHIQVAHLVVVCSACARLRVALAGIEIAGGLQLLPRPEGELLHGCEALWQLRAVLHLAMPDLIWGDLVQVH